MTNGYLVQRIRRASEATNDPDHARALGYMAKFRALEEYFFDRVHSLVDGALLADSIQVAEDAVAPAIMTIHGCRHISDLIESLDKIAQSIDERRGATPLNPLEAYLLLCAAHLHDAGNLGGRKDHPIRSAQLIRNHIDLFYDTETRQNIFDVARVHGGTSGKYEKDTFREMGQDNFASPRLRLLAAMLRIADELSENPERVPTELLNWFQASSRSNLAYLYAQAFRRFDLQNDTLDIQLRVYPEQHEYAAEVDGLTIGFFNHLERKIDVIEREIRYCSQYGRPDFDVRRIRISVEYYEEAPPSLVTNSSTLTLDLDHGYPGALARLSARCTELSNAVSLASYCKGQHG